MHKFSAVAGPFLLATLLLGACSDPVTAPERADPPASGPAGTGKPACAGDSYLRGRLLGAIEADIDWSSASISCEGGQRPDGDGDGARLRFARTSDDGSGLAVIIAIPGLSRRSTGTEFATNVTLILEGEGRFFSTQNREACWADVSGNEPIGDERYAIEGELYCIAPLAEVNGSDSTTLDGLGFRGIVEWSSR